MSFWKNKNELNKNLKASLAAHEANKREAFEGMRAYHRSEIDHKKDTISIFQTLITSVILIYGGLISAIYNRPVDDYQYFEYLGWIIFAVLLICSSMITFLSNKKITKDNERYDIYREEYMCERDIIKLDDDLLSIGYKSQWLNIKNNAGNRHKSGYNYTKWIIIGLNIIICLIGLTGASIVQIASTSHKNTVNKQTHIVINSLPKVK